MGPALSARPSAPSAPTSMLSEAAQMRSVRRSRVDIACLPLLRLEPRRLDDTLGDHAVLLEIAREIGGPVEDRLEPEIDHVLAAERRHAADPHELFVEPGDDGRGRAGGRHEPEIDLRDVAAIAELAQR